jgi:hypothetical protein
VFSYPGDRLKVFFAKEIQVRYSQNYNWFCFPSLRISNYFSQNGDTCSTGASIVRFLTFSAYSEISCQSSVILGGTYGFLLKKA